MVSRFESCARAGDGPEPARPVRPERSEVGFACGSAKPFDLAQGERGGVFAPTSKLKLERAARPGWSDPPCHNVRLVRQWGNYSSDRPLLRYSGRTPDSGNLRVVPGCGVAGGGAGSAVSAIAPGAGGGTGVAGGAASGVR